MVAVLEGTEIILSGVLLAQMTFWLLLAAASCIPLDLAASYNNTYLPI